MSDIWRPKDTDAPNIGRVVHKDRRVIAPGRRALSTMPALRSPRPEQIACIADTHADNRGKAWCGKPATGFTFESVDHAAMNGRAKGRLVSCPECAKAVIEALRENQ